MKLEITRKGAKQDGKALAVGDVVTVVGDAIPPSLVNKARAVDKADGHKAYEDMTRPELDKLAETRGVDIKDAKNKADVIAALQLADEAAKTV